MLRRIILRRFCTQVMQEVSIRSGVWRHKFKFMTLGLVATYPLYSSDLTHCLKNLEESLMSKIAQHLRSQESYKLPVRGTMRRIAKDLKDSEEFTKYAKIFAKDISSKRGTIETVTRFAENLALQPHLQNSAKDLVIKILDGVRHDQQAYQDTRNMIIRVLENERFRLAVANLISKVIVEKEMTEISAKLISDFLETQEAHENFKVMIQACFEKLFFHPDSVKKVSDFVVNVLEFEPNDLPSENSIIDQVLKKVVSSKDIDSRSEIERIINKTTK